MCNNTTITPTIGDKLLTADGYVIITDVCFWDNGNIKGFLAETPKYQRENEKKSNKNTR